MNGIHDMGGMDGFGPIEREENEPVFQEAWEGRVLALNRACGTWGKWNIDRSRFGVEQIPPAQYLASSYYERWLQRLEDLLIDRGMITREELTRSQEAVRQAAAGQAAPGQAAPKKS